MADLLLELLSEEIPARMQAQAAKDLQRLVTDKLAALDLAAEASEAYVTPRRLTLVVQGLPARQPDRTVEVKGPRVGAPEQALAGFLRSAGLASIEACEQRDTGKGVFYFAVNKVLGRPVIDVLAEVIAEAMDQLPWPKSMRWAGHDVRWVRPLHNILALMIDDAGSTVVPVSWALDRANGGSETLLANDRTRGHRFLAPDEFTVTGFADYRAKLAERFVVLDAAERKARILEEGAKLASAQGLVVKPDPGLLDEVAGLVEWPVVRMGAIEPKFMDLPAEVLTTSMRTHQKYFAVETRDGVLAPYFIVVGNMVTRDGGKQMVAGNERVLRARLSDAQFFWELDKKTPLASYAGRLKERIFHAKLGTVEDKVARMALLAETLCPFVADAEPRAARRVVQLAKADLSSTMVGEFPELQGIMGRYLARVQGEPADIADAIAQHYSPVGAADSVPVAPLGIVVSIADKFDSLVGFFAIDEKPTGSKDPYALRRAALGIIRIVLENGLRLPIRTLVARAHALLPTGGSYASATGVADALVEFFADRLKVYLRDQGIRHDLVSAVFAQGGRDDDLVQLVARARALEGFLAADDGANLLIAYRRAFKISQIEEKKDGTLYRDPVDTAKLVQDEEFALAGSLDRIAALANGRLAAEDFVGAMAELAKLRLTVDAFFDRVTVNAEDRDLRINRLRLLAQIWTTLNQVADFSKIEG
ncbi:glycine--tRNA ligase beta subunit [Aliidongia dinghuensis]|uniref:Glycine--tRNA ligase beta subunit n=1 Tax=Aliidongia dinghuensis TaxID=1867774 RepID=A0A8J2YW42_9PROT|nr:glycine--tRNA ligase subunit beta [Aliidongia dinghuensis]GGF26424.1 glycine--tRNA ligase beta subunit [Aliidongia dinghuensis]